MTIHHFNNVFEQVVGPHTKIKGQDIRQFIEAQDFFKEGEFLSSENIQGQKIPANLKTYWGDAFNVFISWNLFEFENQSFIFFAFDNFPLPERSDESKSRLKEVPVSLREKQFFSFRRLLANIKNQYKFSYPDGPELNIKIDDHLSDQILGPEAALYASLHAVFELFSKAKIKSSVRMTLSPHPDRPRVARLLVRTFGHLPELNSMDFYSYVFEALGGSFSTETHIDSDSSIYISIPFDPIAGEIPASPAPEERLPRMVPVGLKTLFVPSNQTNKLIIEHFIEGLHLHSSFAFDVEATLNQYQTSNPDILFVEVTAQEIEKAADIIEKVRSLESTFLTHKAAIIAIIPDEAGSALPQRMIECGANACLSESYSRKNLLEAMIHFAPTVLI